jgi:hypothetical protein
MYLQLAGPQPLDTAENPLAPGAPLTKYDAFYLGQSVEPIPLPDALYKPRVGNFLDSLETLKQLYQDFKDGKKPTPANVVARQASTAIAPGAGVIRQQLPMQEPFTIAAAVAFLNVVIPAIRTILGSLSAGLVNNEITQLYQRNAYNVQNLNRMTARELSLQMESLDAAIAGLGRLQFVKSMSLGQFRLVYQQRFDQISGVNVLRAFPAWVLPAALGIAAFTLIRRK